MHVQLCCASVISDIIVMVAACQYQLKALSMIYHCAALSFILAMLLVCSGFEYHITSLLSDPCPGHPCLTISQFAANTSSYIHSITTLTFLPGIHNLDSMLEIDGVFLLKLSKSNLSQSVKVNCENISRLDLYNITIVHTSKWIGVHWM